MRRFEWIPRGLVSIPLLNSADAWHEAKRTTQRTNLLLQNHKDRRRYICHVFYDEICEPPLSFASSNYFVFATQLGQHFEQICLALVYRCFGQIEEGVENCLFCFKSWLSIWENSQGKYINRCPHHHPTSQSENKYPDVCCVSSDASGARSPIGTYFTWINLSTGYYWTKTNY